jgi:AraC-like DNA-binding protein
MLGSLHGLAMAALLISHKRNLTANRCLSALLVGVVLLITPFTIGYAGFYDAWPWLTYAPFFWQLAFGPLIWLYVRQLGQPALPSRWKWHFLPVILQGGYFCLLFLLPLQAKWDWDELIHRPLVTPILDALIFISLTAYWLLAWRAYVDYQRWLEQHNSAREEYRLSWVRRFLSALALVVAIDFGFTLTDRFVVGLDYFDQFPLYLSFVGLVYYLGIEGWRHAGAVYPAQTTTSPDIDSTASAIDRDWAAMGSAYAKLVSEQGWWRESDLDLSGLARRLGTNTLYLSRALNDGLGQSFSEFINRQRVDAAKTLLAGESNVLDIAGEVGFGSKASFNRAFRTYAGCTPSTYRQKLIDRRLNS